MALSDIEYYRFEHPTLGSMTGLISPKTPDVVTFRAIPYATLPKRFARSILRENLDGISRAFTKVGAACPHNFSLEDIHSGGPHPNQEPIVYSEFDSLILDLNVPKAHLDSTKSATKSLRKNALLPVMTYIHGGGFMLGKIDAQHNTAYMVQHSVAIAQPAIMTAIQYRLGALGFMSTPDGGKNLALWDQRNALLWIQKFIDGFGGDGARHTVFGESAGGFSICYHMLSHAPATGPLFNRAVIMSGVLGPMSVPWSGEEAQKALDEVCGILDIKQRGMDALPALRALGVQKLVDASDAWIGKGNQWVPVVDSELFREEFTWDQVPRLLEKCEWVNEIVVGNTGFEGLTFLDVASKLTPATFELHLRRELGHEATKKVMKTYGVTTDMDLNLFKTAAMRWCGDLIFDAPIHALCRHLADSPNKRVYRYVFDIRNPFPGAPYYQQAHHWVDIYFLFRTLQFRYPQARLKERSDDHARLWIEFANGKEPWNHVGHPDYKLNHGAVMVADERDGWTDQTLQSFESTKNGRMNFTRWEELWNAWGEKKGMRWMPLDMRESD